VPEKTTEQNMASKRTVIVTGASQGIGAAVVQAFLDRSYNVVATSRSVSKAGFAPSPNLALVDARFDREVLGCELLVLERERHAPSWPTLGVTLIRIKRVSSIAASKPFDGARCR
jgi:NAD(P)-dependent dehydrogenase (short-subunit alcohol dehydrogenase family)